MKSATRIWNYKLRGLPCAVATAINLTLKKFYTEFFSFLQVRNLGASGLNNKIYPGVTIRFPGNISLGSNASIDSGTLFKSEFDDACLRILDGCTIGKNVLVDFSGDLSVGNNVMISEGVVIQTHDHGYEPKSIPHKCALTIEDNSWIATKAVVLAGVNVIGRNSIIAAGAVVTKDVPEDSVVGGNPARVIREL